MLWSLVRYACLVPGDSVLIHVVCQDGQGFERLILLYGMYVDFVNIQNCYSCSLPEFPLLEKSSEC